MEAPRWRRTNLRRHFPLAFEPIQPIRPPLHKLPALRQILRVVVRGFHRVALHVSELTLDNVRRESDMQRPSRRADGNNHFW